MVRIGIIGCGKIAQIRHIPEYAANKNVKLHGFFDLNQVRAEEIAKANNGIAYGSYEELIADENIDAVSVLTPNFTHAEITVKALQAGKNVLCEKPMATTLAECELMAKTAAITGKKLMIAQNQRLNPAHIKAKELLNSGIIGDVITFKTTFSHSGADNWSIDGNNSWFLDKSKGCFGAMADLGIHKTDLMVYLLGKKIVKCSAVIKTLNKKFNTGEFISVDDNAFCTYIMEGGIVGTMNASWTNYGKEDNCTEIFGTKGAMYIYKDINHSIIVERLGQSEYFDTEAIQTNDNQTATGIIDMFVDCIINDKKPAISAEDVLPAMKAIFACVRSSEQNSELINI